MLTPLFFAEYAMISQLTVTVATSRIAAMGVSSPVGDISSSRVAEAVRSGNIRLVNDQSRLPAVTMYVPFQGSVRGQ
jgi:hypothetical protein